MYKKTNNFSNKLEKILQPEGLAGRPWKLGMVPTIFGSDLAPKRSHMLGYLENAMSDQKKFTGRRLTH